MKKLTRKTLIKLGVPAVLIPGLLLAASLGWNWQENLKENTPYFENQEIFPKSATVKSVIDGDTLILENGVTVRLTGVDAPNVGQPYFYQARSYTAESVIGEEVELEYEPGYQNDPYGRILAYVWVGKGHGRRLVNKSLLSDGLAKVAIYGKHRKLKYGNEFVKAETEAQSERLNLWSVKPPTPE